MRQKDNLFDARFEYLQLEHLICAADVCRVVPEAALEQTYNYVSKHAVRPVMYARDWTLERSRETVDCVLESTMAWWGIRASVAKSRR